MAFILNDRVKVTSTTQGTGVFALGSATAGFETFATGIGGSAGLAIDGFLLGRDLGMMNKGGKVHAGIGGMIPGGGVNEDTIPTMLTTGEFIMNRKAVDEIGSDTLSFMNNNAGDFGFSKLLGGSGSDLDLTGISTNVEEIAPAINALSQHCLLYTSPSPRDRG